MGDFAAKPEEQRGRKAMRHHENDHAGDADDVPAGHAEEEIAHVHDAGEADHERQFLLREGDKARVEEITDEQGEDDGQAGAQSRRGAAEWRSG